MSDSSQELTNQKEQRLLPTVSELLLLLGIDPNQVRTIRPFERRSHYRAVVNWLKVPQMQEDGSQLARIQGAISAFSHLCDVGEWEKAGELLSVSLNTPTEEPLHIQLETWGYDEVRIELFSRVLGKLDEDWDSIWLNGLGNAYFS